MVPVVALVPVIPKMYKSGTKKYSEMVPVSPVVQIWYQSRYQQSGTSKIVPEWCQCDTKALLNNLYYPTLLP